MKKYSFLFLFLLVGLSTFAQELDFQVTINTPKLQTADPKVFETLETAIQEFMNNTKWTNDVFEQEERIKGSLILNINEEQSATRFTAELAIQAVRPVFNSSEETVTFRYQDKDVWFDYEQYQPLIYAQNTYNDHLTSILAFYAYVIIGLDYDSFSPIGGEPYFERALETVNNIPANVAGVQPAGWRAQDSGKRINRYWLTENLLSPRVRPYRQAMYDYHRQGLDLMSNDAVAGRAIVAQAIDAINGVQRAYPNSMILQLFSDAKSDEITEIFAAASMAEKNKVIQVMTRVDGARSAKYRSIR
ncbi:MAG: DUF4835 family protein [Bacteroidota bacterium]